MQDRTTIATRFSQKSSSYNQFATAQRAAAERLISLYTEHLCPNDGLLLDLGCGPAVLASLPSASLRLKEALHLDISYDSLRTCQELKIPRVLQADMDQLPFKPDIFTSIFSASALQWSTNPVKTIETLLQLLKPKGTLALALLGDNTLEELRLVQKEFSIITHNSYITNKEIKTIASQENISFLHQSNETYCTTFTNARDALRSISQIGATSHKRPLLKPSELRELYRLYEKQFAGDIEQRYHYHFLLLRKEQ